MDENISASLLRSKFLALFITKSFSRHGYLAVCVSLLSPVLVYYSSDTFLLEAQILEPVLTQVGEIFYFSTVAVIDRWLWLCCHRVFAVVPRRSAKAWTGRTMWCFAKMSLDLCFPTGLWYSVFDRPRFLEASIIF